jgi:hypothetical protein
VRVYCTTVRVNVVWAVMGFAPPVVPLTVMVYVPGGVPPFFEPPLPPPQDASHMVEAPNTAISPSRRMAWNERLREGTTKNIPSIPGSSRA